MLLRICMIIFTVIAPLSTTQAACCNRCENGPSAASLLESLERLLDDGLLLQPQLQAQLAQQLALIITTNGVVPAARSFGDFFALMPGDNAATVGGGTPVSFPQDGPTSGGITRVNATTFLLPNVGTYQIFFQVSVDEPGQLVLALDSGSGFFELPATVVGRDTGTTQIVGMSLVTTTVPNSLIQVRNPVGNTPALTITPKAGQPAGAHSVSAHIVITQLQ